MMVYPQFTESEKGDIEDVHSTKIVQNKNIWHKRLGHANITKFKTLHKQCMKSIHLPT